MVERRLMNQEMLVEILSIGLSTNCTILLYDSQLNFRSSESSKIVIESQVQDFLRLSNWSNLIVKFSNLGDLVMQFGRSVC